MGLALLAVCHHQVNVVGQSRRSMAVMCYLAGSWASTPVADEAERSPVAAGGIQHDECHSDRSSSIVRNMIVSNSLSLRVKPSTVTAATNTVSASDLHADMAADGGETYGTEDP
jgi:hypothetical protein